jgi:hypothetical protein
MPYDISLSFGTWAELVLACAFVIAAIRLNGVGRVWWAYSILASKWLAKRPAAMVALAFAIPIAVRTILLIVIPVPQPYVMEEFNHLFLVDTFSSGRLANPIHPLAAILQTYQQLQWPHFMSARPPLPPIFMLLGQQVFGSPFAGNLFAVGVTSAALCWMLLGWIAARWAAIGTFLAITTFCLFGYWVNSYWAPTPIVLGGAILFGLVPRIEARPRVAWAILFVVAMLLLMGTRPFENTIYAASICGWLAFRFLQPQRRHLLGRAVVTVAIPAAIGCGVILAAQLFYNQATTGNPWVMPYQLWRHSQDVSPVFLWQPFGQLAQIDYRAAALFVGWNVRVVEDITKGGLFGGVLLFARHAVTFRDLLGPLLFIPFLCWSPRWLKAPATVERTFEVFGALCVVLILLTIAWGLPGALIKALILYVLYKRWANREERLPIFVLVAGFVGTSLPAFYMNVYFAAFTAPLLVLVVNGLRNLSRWHRPYGTALAGYIMLGVLVIPAGQALTRAAGAIPWGPSLSHFDQIYPSPRQRLISRLDGLPGQHVVFVQATPKTSSPIDPVWNDPDVDGQKIVWLRDIRPGWTATAVRYYAGRRFWLMRLNSLGKYTLSPYPLASLPPPLPLDRLPNRDRAPSAELGARAN